MAEQKQQKREQDADPQVQKAMDVETDQGFRGTEVDPTPNENYTVAGVLAGKPTPESDPKAAEKAHGATSAARSRFLDK